MYSIYSQICNDERIYACLIYRSHSERVENKANRPFYNGKSLLDIKLEQLLQVFPSNRIIIVGDNEEWYKENHNLDDGLSLQECHWITRDIDYMIGNTRPFSEVLIHTYNLITETPGLSNVKHLFITYPTCPTFGIQQYKNLIMSYRNHVIHGGFDSVMTAVAKKGFFWYNGSEVNYTATAEGHQYTQDIKPVHEADNCVWGGCFDALLRSRYLIGEKPYFHENDPIHAVDVDTPEDFKRAQLIYGALQSEYSI